MYRYIYIYIYYIYIYIYITFDILRFIYALQGFEYNTWQYECDTFSTFLRQFKFISLKSAVTIEY